MELGHWFPYIPVHAGPLWDMEREKARECYDDMLRMKDDRIKELFGLLEYNGIELTCDEDGVRTVLEWIKAEVEPDPGNPKLPRPYWTAITFDLFWLTGEVLRKINPDLKWDFYTGRTTSLVYQCPTLINLVRTEQAGPHALFVFLQDVSGKNSAARRCPRVEWFQSGVEGRRSAARVP